MYLTEVIYYIFFIREVQKRLPLPGENYSPEK